MFLVPGGFHEADVRNDGVDDAVVCAAGCDCVVFVAFGTGEGLLWYGICARCKKQAPVVRGAFSGALGAQNRLFWYGSDIRYRKPPSLVRSRYSVRRTAFCGTRCVFRCPLCADNYLLLIQEPEHPERDLIVEDVFSIVLDHIAIFDVFNLFLPFLSPANLKGLSVNLKI